MKSEKILVVQFRLSRTHWLLALALAFLCFHPRPLGSETLTLTTYYPAPYGGYVALLTTGGTSGNEANTLLARNYGSVGIGTNSVPTDSKLAIRYSTAGGGWTLRASKNGAVAIGSYNQPSWPNNAGDLSVGGDLYVNGAVKLKCETVNFTLRTNNATDRCSANYTVVGEYGTTSCPAATDGSRNGKLFLGGVLGNSANWIEHMEQGCAGTMLCCKIQ